MWGQNDFLNFLWHHGVTIPIDEIFWQALGLWNPTMGPTSWSIEHWRLQKPFFKHLMCECHAPSRCL